jgi:hypothetical protein
VPVPAAAVTWIENAASEVLSVPSLTLMTIPEYVPTWPEVGVPVSAPVLLLRLAHDGRLVAEKVSVLPLAPPAVGVKL